MWRIIFVIVVTYIFGVITRPMEPQEGPLWPQTISQSISSNDEDEDISANIYEQRIPTNNHLLNNKDRRDYYVFLLRPPNNKRALAMFARWAPISNFGTERSSIRTNIPLPIGGEKTPTRRMLGQPLRWG